MNGLPLLPTVIVDVVGSAANIVFSFLSLWYAYRLTRLRPENFLWGYLFYVTLAITAFAISRAVGHIVREFFLMAGRADLWAPIAPYSGGFNTLCMISVAAVMIFYHKGLQSYEAIEQKAAKLKQSKIRLAQAARELRELNLNLEDKVEVRAAELSASEKKFRHLFTASKDMVFFANRDQSILDMNSAGSEMLGYSHPDVRHLTLGDLFVHGSERDSYAAMLERDGFVRDFEAEFRKKDEGSMSVVISATALYDEAGNITGSEAIAKDLTRLKTMMEQLVSSEKMATVGQMAAGIAHEINTPLGIILGYSQLMMDDFAKDSEAYQNLEVIERQTQTSRKIVADLLKYSRQSGSLRELVDCNEIVGDSLAVTEHNLHLSHIRVMREQAGMLPPILGDPEKLRQVVVNLVNNARHAMEKNEAGGLLVLRTRLDEGAARVVIEVQDDGSGIPEHIKARVFDPFFTTKPVGKGTGLGLSVSYGIIQEHGGTIEIESPVAGRARDGGPGTLFRLQLPVAGGPAEQAPPLQHPL